jgi:hypothetical protein
MGREKRERKFPEDRRLTTEDSMMKADVRGQKTPGFALKSYAVAWKTETR